MSRPSSRVNFLLTVGQQIQSDFSAGRGSKSASIGCDDDGDDDNDEEILQVQMQSDTAVWAAAFYPRGEMKNSVWIFSPIKQRTK